MGDDVGLEDRLVTELRALLLLPLDELKVVEELEPNEILLFEVFANMISKPLHHFDKHSTYK